MHDHSNDSNLNMCKAIRVRFRVADERDYFSRHIKTPRARNLSLTTSEEPNRLKRQLHERYDPIFYFSLATILKKRKESNLSPASGRAQIIHYPILADGRVSIFFLPLIIIHEQ
jgi:hypothetical protein